MEKSNLIKIKKGQDLVKTCLSFSKVLKTYCENDIEKNEVSTTVVSLADELIVRLEEIQFLLNEI